MLALVLVLILAAALLGAGAAALTLWPIAVIALLGWSVGFVVRPGAGDGRRYYW
jgi:hypothetical protein